MASEWSLVCDRAWILNAIFIVQMLGLMLGSYLSGQMGDRVGRKVILYGMMALHAVTNLLAVFSPSWEAFAAVRFFIGIAVGGILTTSFVVPLEFTSEFWRGVVATIPVWSIGTTLFSFAVFLLKDWRHLHILTATASGVAFLPVFWIPESFRWLAVQGRDVQAGTVATKISRLNKRPLPSLELVATIAESERGRAEVENSEHYTYLDLFRNNSIRKSSLVIGLIIFSMSVIYFGINFNVQTFSGDFYTNFLILSLMELPCILFSLPTLHFFTRRWGTGIHLLILSVACFGITVTAFSHGDRVYEKNEDGDLRGSIIVGLAILAKIEIICAWNVITIFCTELFPTAVRNMAFGYLNIVIRIGSLIGPVFFSENPALLYISMAVMGLAILLGAGLVFLLPETKGRPLVDMLGCSKKFPDDRGLAFVVDQKESMAFKTKSEEIHQGLGLEDTDESGECLT